MAEAFNPDKFLAETDPGPVAQGLRTPPAAGAGGFDPDKFLAETSAQAAPANNVSMLSRRGLVTPDTEDIRGAGQMLDTLGGTVRTGLASSAGLALGKGEIVTPKDLIAAQKGEAPKTSEYLSRLGVPAGPSLKDTPYVGEMLPDWNARDAAGFVGDVLTDPLSYAGRGVKGLNPAGEATEAAGKSSYKSGFKKIDERLVEKGKKPISDVLLENGAPTGTTKSIGEKAEQLTKNLGNERSAAYDKAGKAGVSVDLGHPLPNAEAELAKIRANPTKKSKALADDLEAMMKDFKDQGKVGLDKLSEWKSGLYDELPESAFSGAKVKKSASRFQKALAKDFKEAIEQGGNVAERGLGDTIEKINENLGSLIQGQKPIAMQIRRGETPNIITSVDAILSGHPGLLTLKKGADVAKTTAARTIVGKGLMTAGKSGLLDPAARRGLLNSMKKKGILEEPQGGLLQSKDGE